MGKSTLAQMLWQLAGGMGTSIQIFAVTLIFSLPLGLLVAVGRMSKNPIIRNLVKLYISVMRGTPLMLLARTISSDCGWAPVTGCGPL